MKLISFSNFKGKVNSYSLVGLQQDYLSELKNCYIDDNNNVAASELKSGIYLNPIKRSKLANRVVSIEGNYIILNLDCDWSKTRNPPYTFSFNDTPNYLILDDAIYGWRIFMYGEFGIYGFFNDLKLRRIYNNAVCSNTMVEVPMSVIPIEYNLQGSIGVFVSNGALFFINGNGNITKISGDEYIIQRCPDRISFGKTHIILNY